MPGKSDKTVTLPVSYVRTHIHSVIRDVSSGKPITTFGVHNNLVCVIPCLHGYTHQYDNKDVTLRSIILEDLKRDMHNIMLAVTLLKVEFVVLRRVCNNREPVALIRRNPDVDHPALIYA